MTVRKSYPLAETQFKYEKPDKKDAPRYKSKKEVKRIIKGKKKKRGFTRREKRDTAGFITGVGIATGFATKIIKEVLGN